jgi:hypothetical protein
LCVDQWRQPPTLRSGGWSGGFLRTPEDLVQSFESLSAGTGGADSPHRVPSPHNARLGHPPVIDSDPRGALRHPQSHTQPTHHALQALAAQRLSLARTLRRREVGRRQAPKDTRRDLRTPAGQAAHPRAPAFRPLGRPRQRTRTRRPICPFSTPAGTRVSA